MADILVIGATGSQGGAVVRRLLEAKHTVRGLTRDPRSPSARAQVHDLETWLQARRAPAASAAA